MRLEYKYVNKNLHIVMQDGVLRINVGFYVKLSEKNIFLQIVGESLYPWKISDLRYFAATCKK